MVFLPQFFPAPFARPAKGNRKAGATAASDLQEDFLRDLPLADALFAGKGKLAWFFLAPRKWAHCGLQSNRAPR
jgi:hypothetical protein